VGLDWDVSPVHAMESIGLEGLELVAERLKAASNQASG
jgi:hypothetical protein